MALSYKARRRWALVILLVGLPLYIGLSAFLVDLLGYPAIWVQVLIYVGLGIIWALPFKAIFKGVGQDDPDG